MRSIVPKFDFFASGLPLPPMMNGTKFSIDFGQSGNCVYKHFEATSFLHLLHFAILLCVAAGRGGDWWWRWWVPFGLTDASLCNARAACACVCSIYTRINWLHQSANCKTWYGETFVSFLFSVLLLLCAFSHRIFILQNFKTFKTIRSDWIKFKAFSVSLLSTSALPFRVMSGWIWLFSFPVRFLSTP